MSSTPREGHLIPVPGPNGELSEIDTSTLDGQGQHLALDLVELAAHPHLTDRHIHDTLLHHLHPHADPITALHVTLAALHALTAAIHHDIQDQP